MPFAHHPGSSLDLLAANGRAAQLKRATEDSGCSRPPPIMLASWETPLPADLMGQEAMVKSSPSQMESLTPCKPLAFPSPILVKNRAQSNSVFIFKTLLRNPKYPEVLLKEIYSGWSWKRQSCLQRQKCYLGSPGDITSRLEP